MIRLLLAMGLLASPAAAQAVRVTSGQHDGFVRLALAVPDGAGWQLGRTADGYELQLDGAQRFDVSRVFQRIGRERLAAIWADPASGNLRLRIDCACYAIPFQYRPDVLVIDLRDGTPPASSSFELALNGAVFGPLVPRAVREPPRPRNRPIRPEPYDWTALALQAMRPAAPSSADNTSLVPPQRQTELPDIDSDQGQLAASLLRQLSQGVAEGVIELRQTLPASLPAIGGTAALAQIRIETSPGRLDRVAPAPVAAKGEVCPTDDSLAVQNWMTDAPVALQLAQSRMGLVGEFDRPAPQTVVSATQFLLALGFGAEAQQLITTYPVDLPAAALWNSMAYIIDDRVDPEPAFSGLAACDNAAALWAILGTPGPDRGDALAKGAIIRGFTELPAHLRRLLGPRLVERLIHHDQRDLAETITTALRRIPGDADAASELARANLALANADPATAEAISQRVSSQSGPMEADAVIALIEARTAQHLPISAEQVLTVEALLRERTGSADVAPLARALVLARAGASDFDGAFAALPASRQTEAELWEMLWRGGSDDQFLIHAVGRGPSSAATPVAQRISMRLAALGLGKSAVLWLSASTDTSSEDGARAALAEADGRGALRLLAGAEGQDASALRAQALSLLGDHAGAAAAYAEAGMKTEATASQLRARDWAELAADGPEALRAAANLAIQPATTASENAGALGHARDLVGSSGTARADLERLLSATRIEG